MIQPLAWRGHIAGVLEKLSPTPHFIGEKAESKEVEVSKPDGAD